MTVLVETDEFTIESLGNWFGRDRRDGNYLCPDCGEYTKKSRRTNRCKLCSAAYATNMNMIKRLGLRFFSFRRKKK